MLRAFAGSWYVVCVPEHQPVQWLRSLTGGGLADGLVNGIRLHYRVHGTGALLAGVYRALRPDRVPATGLG